MFLSSCNNEFGEILWECEVIKGHLRELKLSSGEISFPLKLVAKYFLVLVVN